MNHAYSRVSLTLVQQFYCWQYNSKAHGNVFNSDSIIVIDCPRVSSDRGPIENV